MVCKHSDEQKNEFFDNGTIIYISNISHLNDWLWFAWRSRCEMWEREKMDKKNEFMSFIM